MAYQIYPFSTDLRNPMIGVPIGSDTSIERTVRTDLIVF
jgi:hypothetical protein